MFQSFTATRPEETCPAEQVCRLDLAKTGSSARQASARGRPGTSRARPRWDGQSLFYRGEVIKHFTRTAPDQFPILDAFQKVRWERQSINAPASPVKARQEHLRQTVANLNRRLKPGTIRFEVTPDRQGVCWKWVPPGRGGRRKVKKE
jgi:hypothetical protein